jgi:hypothetical protein
MTPREHVDVVVPFGDVDFRVRVHRDGTLEFLDPGVQAQIEYDQAFEAMGGDRSLPLQLLLRWQSQPQRVLGMALVSRTTTLRLAVDYCRRVMPVYHKVFPSDGRPKEILRDLFERSRGKETATPPEVTAINASAVMRNAAHSPHRRYAAECFGRALHYAAGDIANGTGTLDLVTDTAAAAAAHDGTKDTDHTPRYMTPEFDEILLREHAWQVRRFIDVVSAVQEKRRIPSIWKTL